MPTKKLKLYFVSERVEPFVPLFGKTTLRTRGQVLATSTEHAKEVARKKFGLPISKINAIPY